LFFESVKVSGTLRHNIDLGNLSKGVYTLSLSNDGIERSERVIVQ